MAIHRRIALGLTVIIGGLVAAVVVLALVFFNLDRYRRQVISYFEQNTGKTVEIGRLTLTFFPKVTLHIYGFGVKSPPSFPPSYLVKVTRADATIDGWALLHGRMVITSLVLDNPEINLVSDPDGSWNFQNPAATNLKNTFPLCEQYGVVQKEYVEVPPALLKKTPELKKYFAASFAYVKAMKPKPTTKAKKNGSG